MLAVLSRGLGLVNKCDINTKYIIFNFAQYNNESRKKNH